MSEPNAAADAELGAELDLHMAPLLDPLTFPSHAHKGVERVLVLDGSYEDSHGVVHRTGELRAWDAGTAHAFRISRAEPCVVASVVSGREFQSLPLRLLARALGR
jgi:anti-sigma factor ChrR (cupin superfamily)